MKKKQQFILLTSLAVILFTGCETDSVTGSNAPEKEPPKLTTTPFDQTVIKEMDATFSVKATGSDLMYQWENADGSLEGEMADELILESVNKSDSGNTYRCVIFNEKDTIKTDYVKLHVLDEMVAPEITTHPVALSVTEEDEAIFTVDASGPLLEYQWQKDGNDIEGATEPSYTVAKTELSDNGGVYRCIIKNSEGFVTSEEVVLTVKEPSLISYWYMIKDSYGTYSLDKPEPYLSQIFRFSSTELITYYWKGYKSWNSYDNYESSTMGEYNLIDDEVVIVVWEFLMS